MSDLDESPSIGPSWVPTTIGALGRLYCGQSPPSSAVNSRGEGTPYVSGPEQWDGYTIHQGKWTTVTTRVAPAHSIFITVKGAGVGTLFPGIGAAIGRDIYAFEPHPAVDLGFVYRALQFSIQDVIAKARGDIPGLSKSHILDHPVSVPGVATQRKVASKIDQLFSHIEEGERALERVQKLVGRYRQSVLKAAVTGELTREWREKNRGQLESGEALLARILKARREAWEKAELDKMTAKGITPANDKWKQKYEEPSPPDTTDLPELPEGWVWTSLEQLAVRVTDGTHQTPKFTTHGIPFLTIQHLSPGNVHWPDIDKWVSEETYEAHTKSMPPRRDDVIYSAVASYGIAVAIETDSPFMFQRHIAHIRPVVMCVQPKFLEAVLNSPTSLAHAHKVARGVAQKTVTLGDLREFPIPVAPENEQIAVLEAIALESSRLLELSGPAFLSEKASNALRQSVLKAAFSGTLVQQDTTDEPAAKLLERIAAERGTAPAKPNRAPKNKAQEPA